MNPVSRLAAAAFLSAGLISLGRAADAPTTAPGAESDANQPQAVAIISGAGDTKDDIKGTVSFTQTGDAVKIVVDVTGLTPGKHGIHIHQKPDLTAPDLSSAGPHYNPDGASHHHGGPNDPTRHAGDLGNLEADATGHAHLELTDSDLSVDGPKNPVVGHSVIIHAKADDEKTDPAGNSGPRIAGGAIEMHKGTGKK